MAERDLYTLCETVLIHFTASSLQGFVTEHLPEPPGARVLGCIPQLADTEGSAHSWWQYAAGAGDDLALLLPLPAAPDARRHRSGPLVAREQTRIETRPSPEALPVAAGVPAFGASFPTMLRALTSLDGGHPVQNKSSTG
ncbi:hypothetical protein ABZU45_30190 [Streptomyces avermitilis]|uniref:hypothetical protein n=1 Tax=Streptomyces avermitilis TaxID=33903 RepID=UPI0033A98CAF